MSKTKNSFLIEASHFDSPIIGVIQDVDLSKPESFKRILTIALSEHTCAEVVSVSDPPSWTVDTHWPNFNISFVMKEDNNDKWHCDARLSAICIYDNDYKNDQITPCIKS